MNLKLITHEASCSNEVKNLRLMLKRKSNFTQIKMRSFYEKILEDNCRKYAKYEEIISRGIFEVFVLFLWFFDS
jgi:ribosomal protein S21